MNTPSRQHGFTLAEAVIASGFVGIAIAGILSLAPMLARGKQEIVERMQAHAAANELFELFESGQLLDLDLIHHEPEDEGDGLLTGVLDAGTGLIGGLLGALGGKKGGTPDPGVQITEADDESGGVIETTLRGFTGRVTITTVDPLTLDPIDGPSPAARIDVAVLRADREIARLTRIRTNAWADAAQRRSIDP